MGTARETRCIIAIRRKALDYDQCPNEAEWLPRFMFAGAWIEARALFCGHHLLREGLRYTRGMVEKNWAIYEENFQKLKGQHPRNPNDMMLQFIRLENSVLLHTDPDSEQPAGLIN